MRWACALLLALGGPAFGYIAVDASRLTLNEVMLEFPDVLLLSLEKFDADGGAYLFAVDETLQGKPPEKKQLKLHLQAGGKPVERLAGLKKGERLVAFLGSPDNRSLVCAAGGWFLATPDGGWQRFNQFRDDFRQLCDGPPADLADAVRALRLGGSAAVPILPAKGGQLHGWVKYDTEYPHRRRPVVNPNGPKRTGDEWAKLLKSKAAGERQQAVAALAALPDAEPTLLAALKDEHAEVRLAAAAGLGDLKAVSADGVKALTKALTDSDRFVCASAAYGLGRAGAKGAVPELLKALGDRDYDHDFRPHRAAEAAEAIPLLAPGTKDTDKAVEFFLSDKMLRDRRIDCEGTRTAAARALGRSGAAAKAAVPELVKALKDAVPETRAAAAEAVLLIGADGKQREQAEAVLAAAVAGEDVAVAVQAIRACGRTKAGEAALKKRADGDHPALKREAAEALKKLGK